MNHVPDLDPSKNLLHEKFLVINDDVCILAHFEAALSVIDMHDAGRSQARHLDCIFQRNASFQHDGAECTFDRRFSFACISDDVILEHHSPVVNPPLWSQHFAIDDLSSPPRFIAEYLCKDRVGSQ